MFVIRNSQYYEKVSDPLDLSTIEKQILTGHYKTVEAFDTDMLKVFRNAEVGGSPLHHTCMLRHTHKTQQQLSDQLQCHTVSLHSTQTY